MQRFERRSLLDRIVGTCLGLLVGAFALYWAVHLVESVATALIVIAAVIGALLIVAWVIALVRKRRWLDRW